MTFAVTVHALLTAIRSARAFVHKVAIVWPLPALLPEDAPLDDARSRQKPETTAVHRCADSMRADYLLQTVERLRANLDEMRAQRDQAIEALAGRVGVPRDRLTVRKAARERLPIGGADAQALEGALQQVERELAKAIAQREEARERIDRAQEIGDAWRRQANAMLDELKDMESARDEAQAVIADLRRDLATQHADHQRWMAGMLAEHAAAHEALRAVDAERKVVRDELGAVAEETAADGIECLRATLGAREGETALRAAERVVRERDKARAERDEATKELDDLDTGGVVAALRTDRERLRIIDAALGSEGEPLQSVQAMLRTIGAAEGETLLTAVHRVAQRDAQLAKALKNVRGDMIDLAVEMAHFHDDDAATEAAATARGVQEEVNAVLHG